MKSKTKWILFTIFGVFGIIGGIDEAELGMTIFYILWSLGGIFCIFKNIPFLKFPKKKISNNQSSQVIHPITLETNVSYGRKPTEEEKRKERNKMTKKLRAEILLRDNYTCQKCGLSRYVEPNLNLHVDHIIPIAKGGKTVKENLQTLCWRCNLSKGDKIE